MADEAVAPPHSTKQPTTRSNVLHVYTLSSAYGLILRIVLVQLLRYHARCKRSRLTQHSNSPCLRYAHRRIDADAPRAGRALDRGADEYCILVPDDEARPENARRRDRPIASPQIWYSEPC